MTNKHSKQLYPPNIEVHRVHSNGIHTIVQYSYNGKKWYAVNNAERVLLQREIDDFLILCCYGSNILLLEGLRVFICDVFLLTREFLCTLAPPVRPEYEKIVTSEDDLQLVITHEALDITVDLYSLAVCYKNHVSWYPLADKYYSIVRPTKTVEFSNYSLCGIISLSMDFGQYCQLTPPVTKSRIVSAKPEYEDAGVIVETNEFVRTLIKDGQIHLQTGSTPTFIDKGKAWRKLILFYGDFQKAFIYDVVTGRITEMNPTEVRYTPFYYLHRMYNPWHNFRILDGLYRETYNPETGTWYQEYKDLKGIFTPLPAIFDLTVDSVDSQGVFTRAPYYKHEIINGEPANITVIPSNLNLLSHNYVIFMVKVTDNRNNPVPFANVCIEADGGNGDNSALRYFDPDFGGIPKDCYPTDIDGVAFILLRTVNGDFPEHLQGQWSFKVTVSSGSVLPMSVVRLFHSSPTTELEILREELRNEKDLDFVKHHKVFRYP